VWLTSHPQYTLFANASRRGTPPVRPLFFEFPDEPTLFAHDTQWLVGRDVLVSPVLAPGATSVDVVLPGGARTVWRDWWTHAVTEAKDGNATLPAPLGHINVHVRDGAAILLYAQPQYTTAETAAGPYALLVHLAADGYAHGTAYVDDGARDPPGPATELRIAAHGGALNITPSGTFDITSRLAAVTLLGVGSAPKSVLVGGKAAKFAYDAHVQRVNVTGLALDLNKAVTISWK
jgi:alpha-glucosidase